MNNNQIHEVASDIMNAVQESSFEKIDARNGEPYWYYALVSRLAVIVNSENVRYVSHNFTDTREVEGSLWLFTDEIAVYAHVASKGQQYDLEVEAVPRKGLRRLSIDRVSSAFGEGDLAWPDDIAIALEFADGREV